jgi:hypothetical protein
MAHPLDMIGTVSIPRDQLAVVDVGERLAEALCSQTIEKVGLSGTRIEIEIDHKTKLRPGGDLWLFRLWTKGHFEVFGGGDKVSVTFDLRTHYSLPWTILILEGSALAFWWRGVPQLGFLLSLFVMLVILSVLWTRYRALPLWLRRVLTSSVLPPPRKLREQNDSG